MWPEILLQNTLTRVAGAFVTINETDLQGRKEGNIRRARALFADADGPDQRQRCAEFIKRTSCTPSLVVQTRPGRAHFYWVCEDLRLEDFTALQRALATELQSDATVIDLPRVMRLPGTYNLKQPATPHLVRLQFVTDKRWTTADFLHRTSLQALPLHPKRDLATSITSRGNIPTSPSRPAVPSADVIPGETHIDANRELSAGIGGDWSLEDFAGASKYLAELRPSPLSTYEECDGFGWRDFTFACCHAEITRPEHSEAIRGIWATVSLSAGGNTDKNDTLYANSLRSTRQRIARGESVITTSSVFECALRLGWSSEGAASCGMAERLLFVPGNEQPCRETLDRIVAADPYTFTCGEGLVILRVPNREALPPGVTWDGDLPSTTPALAADIMERAQRGAWFFRSGGKGTDRFYRGMPPRAFCADYLIQMQARYGARTLTGIARVPYMPDNGEILANEGYCPLTGVFRDQSPVLCVPHNPTRRLALRAAAELLRPFRYYNFESRHVGRIILLGAVLTALLRPFIRTAPMFIVKGAMAGTGKGQITRAIARLALDSTPVFMTWGHNDEEFQKRLDTMLLASPAMLVIDNANGKLLRGDTLEMIISEGMATIRQFGKLSGATIRNRSFLMATGNNLSISGDMIRRAIVVEVLPTSESPERQVFPFTPEDYVRDNRTALLEAAYTIMRAYRVAGMPKPPLPAAGSFPEWQRQVRDLLHWLLNYDLTEQFEQNKLSDPHRQNDAALVAALQAKYGSKPFKAADVQDDYSNGKRGAGCPGLVNVTAEQVAICTAIEDVWGGRPFNTKAFGIWAKGLENAFVGGLRLTIKPDKRAKTNLYIVRK